MILKINWKNFGQTNDKLFQKNIRKSVLKIVSQILPANNNGDRFEWE